MAELLELQTNIPVTVALAFADGKEFPSKIEGAPPQVMFTLVDGRRVFWPQPFAESLRNAGIAARMPFEVVKRELGKGKTQLQFRAVKADPPTPPVTAAWQEPAPTPPPSSNNGYHAPAPPPPPPARMARYMSAYKDACDILIETREYLNRKGFQREFEFADIRALSATMMIDEQKGGGR